MPSLIHIIGVGADGPSGLRADLIERIHAAEFLAGGDRHLAYFPAAAANRFVLKDNLTDLLKELANRFGKQRCVVLASGDPLFYGVGNGIIGIMGSQTVRIEPALSSMQLAFARAGIPWQSARLASIHGRNSRSILLPLLGQKVIGLFTQDGDSPAQVAQFFLKFGLGDYEAFVGENLGSVEERTSHWADLKQLADQHFAPLNYLVLRRTRSPLGTGEIERNRAYVPGVPDEVFARPDKEAEVMTRQEVRSVLLGKLGGSTQPGDTVWDIGAGLGTVAVEIAVLRPHLEVLAVERDPVRAAFIEENRQRFDAYNIRIVRGVAPQVLEGETDRPCMVFIGGSGDHLPAILGIAAEKLLPGGRLAGNFVTLEHLGFVLQCLREWDWPSEVTEVHVARSDQLANLTGLKPQRGVFLVKAVKPGGDP